MITKDSPLIEEKDFFISYNQEEQFSFLKFNNKCSSTIYHRAYNDLLRTFHTYRHHKHITDTSDMGVVSIDDQKWVKVNIVPQIRQAVSMDKTLNIGLVLGRDIFATIAAKNIAKRFDSEKKTHIQFFPEKEKAHEWLLNTP